MPPESPTATTARQRPQPPDSHPPSLHQSKFRACATPPPGTYGGIASAPVPAESGSVGSGNWRRDGVRPSRTRPVVWAISIGLRLWPLKIRGTCSGTVLLSILSIYLEGCSLFSIYVLTERASGVISRMPDREGGGMVNRKLPRRSGADGKLIIGSDGRLVFPGDPAFSPELRSAMRGVTNAFRPRTAVSS